MTKTAIRFYTRRDDGVLEDMKFEFDIREFGDRLPIPGDFIVNPFAPSGRDRHKPSNREVYEVQQRYFFPGTSNNTFDEFSYCALVVKIRAGTQEERDFFYVS